MKRYFRARFFGGLLYRAAAATTMAALLTTFFLFTPLAARADTVVSVSLTATGTAYAQNFDSLVSTGTGTLAANTPNGWGFVEALSSANTSYTAGTGSGNTGDTLSFGSLNSTERAFGQLDSNNLTSILGARFINNTGSTLTSLDIAYTGEQWRSGDINNVADILDFEYSTDATSLSNGTWTAVNQLDFSSLQTTAAAGLLDGNAAANRAARSQSISGLSLANGATFWIRWVSTNISNSDDGLAIDDFSITPQGGAVVDNPPTVTATVPADNAVNIAANANVSVTFSEPVTATGSSFQINCATSGTHPFVLSGGATTYTLDPATDFTPGEVCTVTVLAAQVADQDGTANNPAQDYVFDFTVAGVVSTNPSATGAANPNPVSAGSSALLTVTVTPGTNPASTGIAVNADLTAIGGSPAQSFLDNGTGGDAAAGDNIFSYQAAIPGNIAAGGKTLPVSVGDAQSRTATASISLTVTAPVTGQTLPFSQNWSNTGLITANDNWSQVPGIVGYLGNYSATAPTGVDPQTLLTDFAPNDVDVIANQTSPDTLISGGVAEFEIADPVVALQGSGTADAPHLVISINTTGQDNITVSYNLRDVDGSDDTAIQPVALQYRVGSTGNYTNVPAAFVADASDGPNEASLVTPVNVALPAAVNNQPLVQLRVITTNAVDSDEWIGVDDINIASGGTLPLTASGSASPVSVIPGGTTLLRVTVNPATNPDSSGITVTGDLTSIGGSATQNFFNDGTNGDAAANDNVYSYQATVAAGTTTGAKSLPVTVTDAQSRNANINIGLTVSTTGGTHNPQEHLVMGNPSNATTDVNNPFNYLLLKDQYVMSYHRDRAIPNWVSWHLDSTWLGSAPRQNDFRPDSSLPAGWYQVSGSSYSGSGFDRGHHTPSGDRTSTVPDNSATFFMTNMMPQAPGNNQGPWEKLESYSRTLVGGGSELYIIGGGIGTGGTGDNGFASTIDSGRVTVPAQTWKVIIVLPVGDDDVARVNNNTRTIGVIMPNNTSIRPDQWQQYVTTVDQVEALTGYDFFSNVPVEIQNVIESRLDGSNVAPPTIVKSFSPSTVAVNETSTLSLTITNPAANAVSLTGVGVIDNFPAGLEVDATPAATNSCATGTFAPLAAAIGISVSGATIPAGVACTFTVKVKGATVGSKVNTTGNVTSANGGTGGTATATLTVADSFESDVASRPGGDGYILSDDVIQVQRFQIGLDQPFQSNEFQRADSAPFASRGDGLIQSDDVIQAQRYQIGLDAKQTAAGPTAPSAMALAEEFVAKSVKADAEKQAGNLTRALRVENVSTSPGQSVTVNIRADAIGDESGYGFQLNFNPSVLTNPSVSIGTAGGARFCNTTTVSGQITCSVNGFQNNNPASSTDQIGEIAAGNNQLLVTVRFTVAATAAPGMYAVTISNVNTSNDRAQSLTPITATSGTVTIAAPTAAAGEISGRVMAANGRGIFKARVFLTDSSGETKTALTNPFGYYRFADIKVGETYVISANHKTYRFESQVLSINGNLNEVIISAIE